MTPNLNVNVPAPQATGTPLTPQTSSQGIGNQIYGLVNESQNYNPASSFNIQSAINNQTQGLRPQYEDLAKTTADAANILPQGISNYAQKFGGGYTPGAAPDMMHYITGLLGNYNQQMTRADALRGTIGQMGGGINNLVSNIKDMYQQGQDNIYKRITAMNPLFQGALTQEQNQMDRQQKAELQAQALENAIKTANIGANATMSAAGSSAAATRYAADQNRGGQMDIARLGSGGNTSDYLNLLESMGVITRNPQKGE